MTDRNKDLDRDLAERGTENQIEGSLKEVEGKARSAAGDLTDDTSEKMKGKAKELEGKIQKGFGETQRDIDKNV